MSNKTFGITLAILIVAGVSAWLVWNFSRESPQQLVQRGVAFYEKGDYAQAEELGRQVLDLAPTDHAAALLAAKCAIATREYQRADQYLERLFNSSNERQAETALLRGRLNQKHLYRFSVAESAYRDVLEIEPGQLEARQELATLLVQCGRHQEAVPHIVHLIRRGVFTGLVFDLGIPGSSIQPDGTLEKASLAEPDNPGPLLGLALLAAKQDKLSKKRSYLQKAIQVAPASVSAQIALAKHLLEERDWPLLGRLMTELPSASWDLADAWIVRGALAEHSGDLDGAIRCDWEAVKRSPESKRACYRLVQLLAQSGKNSMAEPYRDHLADLKELESLQIHFESSPDHYLKLARVLDRLGRVWEAFAWCGLAYNERGANPERELYQQLKEKIEGIPLKQTLDSANPARKADLSDYPLPKKINPAIPSAAGLEDIGGEISFREEAEASGLRFTFFNGRAGPATHRMYELTGGGIGVMDYDLDGFPDAFFSQGILWPEEPRSSMRNDQLFRNIGGESFEELSHLAGISESDFGQGVTIGDFNADGFPDVYVANIGGNQLWMNNGDGTFTDGTRNGGLGGTRWTTSCLMADLNGDALPDLFDVNYMQGPDIFERVCQYPDGTVGMCMPFRFDPAPDQLWINNGEGGFATSTKFLPDSQDGKGLGVLAWAADPSETLSLFVANDATPNSFLVPRLSSSGEFGFEEAGLVAGLAYNGEGQNEGCMGIAFGDVNEDGHGDLFVTNFHNESNTLYLRQHQGFFLDSTDSAQLGARSRPLVGFGTQFLDANLDGRPELFVSNGDIEDRTRQGIPFAMRPQLFANRAGRFAQIKSGLGPYFERSWVGRSVVRWDWNSDGRPDLLVGHLESPAALLTNTTPGIGHFLILQLVGVQSNRDALGTVVQAKFGEKTLTDQLVGGDGYQASNQRFLILGTGKEKEISELIVRWPSGREQRISNIQLPHKAVLVEGGALRALAGGF